MAFCTLTAREKTNKVHKVLPILANWICKSVPHYYKTGLYLQVPYYHLISYEEKSTSLVGAYLKLLEYVYPQYGDVFPEVFLSLIEQLNYVGKFDRLLKRNSDLDYMFKGSTASDELLSKDDIQATLMKVLFLVCEASLSEPGFDLLICSHMNLSIEDIPDSLHLEVSLFKLCIKGYVSLPFGQFGRKLSLCIHDACLSATFSQIVSQLHAEERTNLSCCEVL